jgi:hypothetical protein
MASYCAFVAVRGVRAGQPCGRPLKGGHCRNHPSVTEVPAQGSKRQYCLVVAVRGVHAGQPYGRPLNDGRCRNHPNEESPAAAPPAPPVPAELTMESAADAEVTALAAVESATEVDKPMLMVVLRKASHAKARAIAHEGLATKTRAILQHQATLAMVAAGQVALAELDVEGQTLTAQRSEKNGRYMKAEMQYWSPFVQAK